MLRRMGSFNVALLEALLSAGVSPERARAVVDLFERSVDERYSLHAQVLATKRDVAELETRLARDIAAAEARVAREIADLSGRVTRDIASGKVDLVKWAVGALTAQTALLLGASKLL
jgi:hypothetical protein